jgi:hypothetical protein
MTWTWQLRGWEDPRHGDDPRMVIVGAESEREAAFNCYVAVNVLAKATPNEG